MREISPLAGIVAEQFDDRGQQRQAAEFGMWIFLGTEVLFFGAIFLGYTLYRMAYPAAFAEAGRETLVLIGSANTAILLTSSLTAALAVKAAEFGRSRLVVRLIAVTIALGLVFLALKGYEYHHDIKSHFVPGDPLFGLSEHAVIFVSFYWAMTGIHAIHMAIGLGAWVVVAILVRRGRVVPDKTNTVEVVGLYWHFVDTIWIFLYPLLYLVGRS
ncbi:cytochrome c oxidase subunit 3 family protein [Afifella marina]|uniref:Cytochrome c oxidase subunit 3 n=2 Tax=Hyphomicrobiales TaxID=356 RepID=A0A1G5MUW2_AFIMA|nr:cytochrome c oxidase subunit 3 family protein [Afifella marina]MBK1621978.1 hypothetical protein [Afifella marina DSM 2698]MBK1627771.1 hypothetical protein [Afifella marina]MBK5916738.1 hypothetical protein [Afifella marina]RAI19935.1 hypothetical protein CH311_11540 [Afifella marina DSM 2698]SCZ28614.1 cytochrome c oxidase subunit 3 [Afifella marina DSM 2698]